MSMESPESAEKKKFEEAKRSLANKAFGACVRGYVYLNSISKLGFEDGIKYVKSGQSTAGLIEGALIAPKLAYVDSESGQLIYKEATNSALLSFDAMRPSEFNFQPEEYGSALVNEGVMWSYMPEEIKDNPGSLRTPTHYISGYDINHLFTVDKYPLDHLIGEQILRSVSMDEAFEAVGLEEYIPGLEARRIAKDRVYQVTPKGNTLVSLEDDDGDSTPKFQERFSYVKVPGLQVN
mgnify:CR=1 FL=1